jgi:hypothetical protein
MTQTFDAVFDGSVLRPETALPLAPNTRVRVTLETVPITDQPTDFLATAESVRFEGPADWSANLDKYLYGHADRTKG